jgi:antitoxin MazE
MLTALRQIGNSKGVLIPAAFLRSCAIDGQIDMSLQDGNIVIKPVKRYLREGWFAHGDSEEALVAKLPAERHTPSAVDSLDASQSWRTWADAPLADDSEWQW